MSKLAKLACAAVLSVVIMGAAAAPAEAKNPFNCGPCNGCC